MYLSICPVHWQNVRLDIFDVGNVLETLYLFVVINSNLASHIFWNFFPLALNVSSISGSDEAYRQGCV
jgi:hypothetical protein